MIEVWKHLNWKCQVNKDLLVKYEDTTHQEMKKQHWERAARQKFFAYQTVTTLNNLPESI